MAIFRVFTSTGVDMNDLWPFWAGSPIDRIEAFDFGTSGATSDVLVTLADNTHIRYIDELGRNGLGWSGTMATTGPYTRIELLDGTGDILAEFYDFGDAGFEFIDTPLVANYLLNADDLAGNDGGDILEGGYSDDVLRGGLGVDHLFGEDGDDTLFLAIGEDTAGQTFDGGAGTGDKLVLNGLAPARFDLSDDILTDIEILEYANAGGVDAVVDVHIDADQLSGVNAVRGNIFTNMLDRLTVSMRSQTSLNLTGKTFANFTGNDRVIVIGDADAESITGGSARDTLLGYGGADMIAGGGGDDLLLGGDGDDIIDGGSGDDSIEGGDGNDMIDGGAGVDRAYLPLQPQQGYLVTGTANDFTVTSAAGTDRYRNVEVVLLIGEQMTAAEFIALPSTLEPPATGPTDLPGTDDLLFGSKRADTLDGGGGNDQIYGKKGADTLFGGSGADLLDGGKGNDLLDGGNGDDWLVGGKGADALLGGKGNDRLEGGKGADRLDGGAGADVMLGGKGADSFVYASFLDSGPAARDMIFGFEANGKDRLDFGAIDAIPATATNDAFAFIGAAGFTGAGQVRIVSSAAGGMTVEANLDADLGADMAIEVFVSKGSLDAADFLL